MNTFELTLTLPKSHYYQIVNSSSQFELVPQNLSIRGQNKVVNQLNVNSSGNSMTIGTRGERQKQLSLARAKEYQRLLKENGWTRAELARRLGGSRAWVTTVLRVDK